MAVRMCMIAYRKENVGNSVCMNANVGEGAAARVCVSTGLHVDVSVLFGARVNVGTDTRVW